MFGTDGVRGAPGSPPLDRDTIARLGAALAAELGGAPRIVCGRDTRESGAWIEACLGAGIRAGGGTAVSLGVMPTPGVALVTARHGFDAGIVISASHNPFPDNGIKLLQTTGEKASRELERRIEARVAHAADGTGAAPVADRLDTVDLMAAYVDHLVAILGDTSAAGARVAIDCAHGATSVVAPRVFRQIGASVVELHVAPDGRNINEASGSTHPEALQAAVVAHGCRLGFAFDGDGDRVILVDHRGRLVDGDGMLYVAARYLRDAGRLAGDGVVATVMSNIGLEVALRDAGIVLHRCPVGDWHVREAMVSRGVGVGGEQSGHIIFADLLPTGDGLGTALRMLRIVLERGRELADLVDGLTVYPQVLRNVPVSTRPDLAEVPALVDSVRAVETRLAGQGRVLVRYSGTEPFLRIMIEGPDQATVERLADEIAGCARRQLG